MSYENLPLKTWALEDRPREKLLQKGISALTDSELVALLLATGTRRHSVMDLARQVLQSTGGLEQLARSGVAELTRINGIGKAKAIALVAAFELGRRKAMEPVRSTRITDSEVAANYLQPRLADLNQEVFYVLFLNRNNEIKGERQIFQGGVSATVIDPRIVFREAVHHLASSIILAHNHPSGNLTPSRADLEVTRKLVEGGKLVDIQVMDHLIVSERGYYSFADEGLI